MLAAGALSIRSRERPRHDRRDHHRRDELLIGQVINTNQAFIAERVNGLGIRIGRMTTVSDDLDSIVASFAAGGNGPTWCW